MPQSTTDVLTQTQRRQEIAAILGLRCPRCGEPMRIIAFVLDRDVIERILSHIGEPTEPPAILPARSPPQGVLDFARALPVAPEDPWPEVDQTADLPGDSWE
jgi:hypothetical protein